MLPETRKKQSKLMQLFSPETTFVRAEVTEGLSRLHACISPKYLYDSLGSKLFTAICELEEYYPTRTEAAIYNQYIKEISEEAGQGATLIDLGAGDCKKAEALLPHLQPVQYVPVDISADFLHDALQNLQNRFPEMEMIGLGMDFSTSVDLPDSIRRNQRLFFYPGSSIGNFTPQDAIHFLKQLRAACNNNGHAEGSILIGVDLVKDAAILDAAYDDALGVTAAFNLNILLHINRLLKADFDVRDWRHKAYFNAEKSRIEMHLVARSNVTVRWEGGQRRFERGETIHTESSYKYTQKGFVTLLEQAGFGNVRIWTDERKWFMVCHAQAI